MLPAGEPNKVGAAGKPNDHEFEVRIVDDDDDDGRGRRDRRDRVPAHGPEPDVRRLLEPARGDRRGRCATSGSTPATSAGSTTTASSTSSTARRTTCGAGARTSRASRWSGRSSAHAAIKDVAVHAVASDQGEDDVKVTAVLQDGATRHRGGAVPVVGGPGAVLRGPALHRVPRRPAAQPGRAGPEVRAARRRRDRRAPGTARRPASRSSGAEREHRAARIQPAVRAALHQPHLVGPRCTRGSPACELGSRARRWARRAMATVRWGTTSVKLPP